MLVCALLGFSSGLPLYTLLQLVPAWLRSEGVSLRTIGMLSLAQLPYAWKFLWAPLLDRFAPAGLGRHRGWALATQALLFGAVAALAALEPASGLTGIVTLTVLVALFSATQDIALDGYRRELLADEELGLGNALFVNLYRVAGLIPGGLALVLADGLPWSAVHLLVASFMGVGMLGVWLAPRLETPAGAPRTLREAVVGPLREFFARGDLRSALALLAFLLAYKLGDAMATALVTPFYLDVGFSLAEIGTVAKLTALWSMVAGSLLGGLVITRVGINRALWLFGVFQMVAILGFVALGAIGPDILALAVVVTCEYLGVGLGTSAFVAFTARATSRAFSATQYALFSSLVALPRSVVAASTGYLVEWLGYGPFFLLCVALSLPGMALLPIVAPWSDPRARDP
jgi:PAT family beta-lactamase induction signal transducer AmpG